MPIFIRQMCFHVTPANIFNVNLVLPSVTACAIIFLITYSRFLFIVNLESQMSQVNFFSFLLCPAMCFSYSANSLNFLGNLLEHIWHLYIFGSALDSMFDSEALFNKNVAIKPKKSKYSMEIVPWSVIFIDVIH